MLLTRAEEGSVIAASPRPAGDFRQMSINQPGDIYEQEADLVAAQVLARPPYGREQRSPAHPALWDNRTRRRVRRLPV
jgi:hypothetical protein